VAPETPDVLPVAGFVPDAVPDVSLLASVVVEVPCAEFDAALLEEGVFVVGRGTSPVVVTFPFTIIVGYLKGEDTRISADCCTFFSAARIR
jgi:hypothetical protein